ncbi:MAG: right-handed parallel beta-helix repeat-containing protein [Puniceicoccaceae bacterium]
MLPAGVYYVGIDAPDSEAFDPYELDINPGTGSSTRVFYLNSPSALPPDVHSFYSLAPGDDSYTDAGLDPNRPAATIERIISLHNPSPDDIILFDTGTYTDALSLSGAPAGMTLGGAPNERFEDLDPAVVFGSYMQGSGSNPGGSIVTTQNLTLARFIFADSDTGLKVTQSDNFSGVGLAFENNVLGLDIIESDFASISDSFFSGPGELNTGLQVANSTGFTATDNEMVLLDTGMALVNTNDASVEGLETGEVENVILAEGGSGLSITGLDLEGAEVTQTDLGISLYNGSGQTAISVTQHSNLSISNADIYRYGLGMRLIGVSGGTVSGIYTEEVDSSLIGYGLSDLGINSSVLVGSEGNYAVLIGQSGNQASPSNNVSITQSMLGVTPQEAGLQEPVQITALIQDVGGLTIDNVTLHGHLEVLNSTNLTVTNNFVYNGSLHFKESGNLTLTDNQIHADSGADVARVRMELVSGATVERNFIEKITLDEGEEVTGKLPGIGLELVSSDTITIENNIITRIETGLQVSGTLEAPASNTTVELNSFTTGTTGIFLVDTYTSALAFLNNAVDDYTDTGIHAVGAAEFTSNRVENSGTGIRYEADVPSLFSNIVENNGIGMTGGGYLGNDDRSASRFNFVTLNGTGILAEGDQQVGFNYVWENGIGLQVTGNNVTAHHNIVHRNTDIDVQVTGASGTALWNNTVYSTGTYAVHLTGDSANTDLRNNIVWNDGGGTVLGVDFRSGDGITSDYNTWYASGGAVLFEWIKTFDDILDWQIELGLDLNSLGNTRIDPTLDEPAFVDLANNNFEIVDLTSRSINSGDPSFDFSNEPGPDGGPNGLRINQGAFGDTALAALSASAYIRVLAPNYYLDYTPELAKRIIWEFFNATGNVSLELIEDGVGKVADIAIVTVGNVPDQVFDQPASHGSYLWSPQMNSIAGDNDKRYFIRVTSADDNNLVDENREPFSIPVTSNAFYVNDASTAGDKLTTAMGDNRYTGKLPSTPKAILPAILQNYFLAANQTVSVDTGYYLHLRDILISSADELGNNEAFTLTGPAGDPSQVLFDRSDEREGSSGLLLDDASFVTIRNLSLTGGYRGIEARNFSTFLALENLQLDGHTGIQVHIHDGSERATLDNLHLLNGGGDGLVVDTLLQYLTNSTIDNHQGTGVYLTNTGNTLVQGNIIRNSQDDGLYVNNTVGSTETLIGHDDLSLGLGNILEDNRGTQLYARGNTKVVGNAVTHTDGGVSDGTGIGIYLRGVDGLNNVVGGHSTGIYATTGAIIEGNRIYNNTLRAIGLNANAASVERNVIYSSTRGIEDLTGQFTGGAVIRNNLILDFTEFAYKTTFTSGYVFENNTVYSVLGDGLVIRSSTGGTVVNNIFHLENGTAIDLDFSSQVDLASDYNIFDMAGTASVGTWAGGSRTSLQDWRNAAFLDGNSLAIDPLFIDVDGADNKLGYASPEEDGRDDNFHLQSTEGSIRNGSLAPVIDAGSGLPVVLQSFRVTDASQSPGIDRGDATYSFDLEPSPNGNFINIGAFGNTELASLSPVAYVLVTSPNGGETWPIEQTFTIEWRSQDFNGSVDILLMQEGNPTPVATIASATENDGSYDWALTNSLTPAENYRIEVVRNDDPSVSGQSLNVFAISEPISFYYVNDDLVEAGNYTSAPGDNANDGLSPATPKASIRAILDTYDLGEGDVILVDAGTYAVTTNIFIEAEDSMVTIRGFKAPDSSDLLTVLDRGNPASGSYVFELTGVDGLTIEWITFTGAHRGIYAGVDQATNLTVSESHFIHNENAGIFLDGGNRGFLAEGNYFKGSGILSSGQGRQTSGIFYEGWEAEIRGNLFERNYGEAIYLDPDNTSEPMEFLVEGNTIDAFRNGIVLGPSARDALIQDNTVYNSEVEGIDARGARTIVTNNTVYDNNVGINVIFGAMAIENVEVRNNTTGISVGRDSSAIRNVVYDNTQGIYGNNAATYEDNVAYGNGTGFRWNYNTLVFGNVAYNNARGFHADGYIGSNSQWRASMYNNLAYGNTEYAMKAERTVGSPQITNNTFVQAGVDSTAVILDFAPNIRFTNNIVVIDAGQAMSVFINSQPGFTADYNLYHLTGGASAFLWGELPLYTQLDWFYNVGADAHSLFTDPLFVDPLGGNYHLAPDSPAIDAGNPDTHYQLEPEPAGGRVNLGAYGNTSEATVSPAQTIQILNPVGLDKLLEGQPSTMEFITSGFLDSQQVAWYNTGNTGVGSWIRLPGATGVAQENISASTAIDLSNVENPAPEEVYRLNWRTASGVGQSMDLVIDLLPGDYRLRMHFIDTTTSANDIFDVEVNGQLVLDDYSVFAAAGGRYIAIVEEVDVTIGEEGKAVITITSGNRYGRIAAVEALRLYGSGSAEPPFNVAVSFDSGGNFTSLASGVTVDSRGIATVDWTPFASTSGRTAQLIVASVDTPSVTGLSQLFLVANDGNSYYVNDGSLSNDVYTTAIGNNANSGKSPDSPMASLEALLTVYSPLPGDTIYIDSGTYNLTRNIVLTAEESGITIKGAFDPDNDGAESVFDRNNQANGAYGIEIAGASGITIEHLTITDAYAGIFAANEAAQDLTILNSKFIFNEEFGVSIGSGNLNFLAEGNFFAGDGTFNVNPQDIGLFYGGNIGVIRDNTFVNNYRVGLDVGSPSPNVEMNYLVEGNEASGSLYGIRADGWVNDALVRNNTVYENSTEGIVVNGNRSVVTGNIIHGNNIGIKVNAATAIANTEVYNNSIGIYVGTSGKAIDNIVRLNAEGIRVSAGAGYELVKGNLSYDNTNYGFRFNHSSHIVGNVAYGNRGGFYADDLGSNSQFRGIMHNNLSYGNSEFALLLENTRGVPKIYNNTFVQTDPAATAIILDRAANVFFQNNIIVARGATALTVPLNSQAGFDADYNVWDVDTSLAPFIWGDFTFSDQAEWYYGTSRGEHSVFADPVFVDPDNGDYHLKPGSPGIDAGDPEWGYEMEPIPAGGRLNAGAYGNTAEATTSPAQTITIIDPTFLAKPQQNSQTEIRFHTSGFLREQSVAFLNAGDDYIGGWLPLEDRSTGGAALERVIAVDTDGVINPAPQSVYHQYMRSSFGAGSRIDVPLELNPGEYVLRLHFAMVNGANAGLMDIEVDGVVAVAGYDIDFLAGGTGIAVVEEVAVTVDESGQVTVSFVSQENYAYINAIEVVRVDDTLAPEPLFDIDLSFDRGENFTSLATSIAVDSLGMASVPWIPEASTNGLDAVIRVTGLSQVLVPNQTPVEVSGFSTPFLVVNDGNRYYVNDSSTENDVFTKAAGNNLNSGKSPFSPMASLEALFLVHTPKAGDIVYVDTGTYLMTYNILLTEGNSGITIIGASDPENSAVETVLDRANLNSPSYIFEIDGADDLTIDSLTITKGYRGIMVYEGQGENLTIRNSRIISNVDAGVYVALYNPGLLIEGSHFEGAPGFNVPNRQEQGLETFSTDLIIRNSTFINHYFGAINLNDSNSSTPQALILDSHFEGGGSGNGIVNINEDYTVVLRSTFANGDYSGLYLQGANSVVRDSVAYGNDREGFNIRNNATAENNVAYNNTRGFYGNIGAKLLNNVSFNNTRGMFTNQGLAQGNRVYGNVEYGIGGYLDAQIIGNQVYSNDIGIRGFPFNAGFNLRPFTGRITDNLVYDNGTTGIHLEYGADFVQIINNSVYQPAGNALYLRETTSAYIFNNILWVDAGFGINIDSTSLVEAVNINYNLFNLSPDPNARIGFLDETFLDNLADWQGSTNRDSQSIFGDPIFFDMSGADDVQAYRDVDGIFIDGGEDDNYHIQKLSPAIDRGHTWWTSKIDLEGDSRLDDPGVVDIGDDRYVIDFSEGSLFDGDRGIAQGWTVRWSKYTFDLPFEFTFFGDTHTQIEVSTYGNIAFPSSRASDTNHNIPTLLDWQLLAPFWADVTTDAVSGRDIFIDTSVPDEVYIRWEARAIGGSELVQFAILLKADGSIRLDYGQVVAGLDPLVGLSYGNGIDFELIEGYNGAEDLSSAPSVTITRQPGITDIGAYEFKGNSLDSDAPVTIGTEPLAIENGGTYSGFLENIVVVLSEAPDSIDVSSPATYELILDSDGDELFTDADTFYDLIPIYDPQTNSVNLIIEEGPLPDGDYRFRIQAGNLRDVSGNPLDGDGDGEAGGDYLRQFIVRQPVLPEFTSADIAETIINEPFNFQVTATESPFLFAATGLPQGMSIDAGTGLISGTPTVSGEFSVILSATNGDGVAEMTLELNVLPVPQILDTVINNGDSQRSMVTRIEIKVDSDISGSLLAEDISFLDLVTDTYLATESIQVNWSFLTRTITITFPGLAGGSLPDGDYVLEILSGTLSANDILLDGDGDGVQGGKFTFSFHRLFGDLSGNRTVDVSDSFQFRASYNSEIGQVAYQAGFDYNSDGLIDASDGILFTQNLRTSLDSVVDASAESDETPLINNEPASVSSGSSGRYWSSYGLFRTGDRLFSSMTTSPAYGILHASIYWHGTDEPFWHQLLDDEEENWIF